MRTAPQLLYFYLAVLLSKPDTSVLFSLLADSAESYCTTKPYPSPFKPKICLVWLLLTRLQRLNSILLRYQSTCQVESSWTRTPGHKTINKPNYKQHSALKTEKACPWLNESLSSWPQVLRWIVNQQQENTMYGGVSTLKLGLVWTT